MRFRKATADDTRELAQLNKHLIEDEGHDNPMNVDQLEQRMRGWLARNHHAVLFEEGGATVAYALYRDEPGGGHHLRQFFVSRERRRRGVGRRAMELLTGEILRPGARLRLEVLSDNARARAFYDALGFRAYAIALERDTAEARVGAYNFAQATGAIATSGIVPPEGFGRIARAGYRHVINLLPGDSEHALAQEASLVAEHGMGYVHIPVDFARPTEEDYGEFVEAMRAAGDDKVWVHCAANYRVSCFVSRYARAHLGWSRAEATRLVASIWEPDAVWRRFVDAD